MDKFLRVNLQFFAEEDPEGNDPQDDPRVDDPENTESNDEDTQGEEGEKQTDGEPDKDSEPNFTQADVDRIVKERLERERKKQEREDEERRKQEERERLKEQERYKELYEELQEQLDQQKQEALATKKESLLAQAGYDEKQVKRYAKYLEGESDEELEAALDELKEDIPPKRKYGDPNPGNASAKKPEKKGLQEKGKTAYQRLKEKGKIRNRSK